MARRSVGLWVASAWLLACGDDASTTSTDGSSSGPGSSSSGPVDLDTTGASSVGPTSESSTDDTTDATTTDATTTEGSSSTGPGLQCGNGVIEGDEICDGENLDGQDCASQGFDYGELGCVADCSGFDTSFCTIDECGSDLATGEEACDGTDLRGQTCLTQGFDSGTLGCALNCSAFDTSACGTCGNVIIDGDEACDGLALLGQTCITQGFEYGELACAADCLGFDTAGCGVCGDGSVGGAEACDGADLDGASCMSLGLGGGILACQADCTVDTSGCDGPGFEVVGFPIATDPRFIQAGTRPWNAGDWFEGVRMTGIPSLGQLDVHLEIGTNSLADCGVQEAEVSINGVALGTFSVVQGTVAIDQSYPVVPPIAGPQYTIRYETTTTVAGGCGSAEYDEVGSTVTFHPG